MLTSPSDRPVVALPFSYYLPGYRAGGPTRSLHALVEELGDDFDFRIIALDRDFGSDVPYAGIPVGKWHQLGKCQVIYLPPDSVYPWRLWQLLRQLPYDLLYLNGLFSWRCAITPLWFQAAGLLPQVPILCAPRGQLAPQALAGSPGRKHAYLALLKHSRVSANLRWHATSEAEISEIGRFFGREARVSFAPAISRVTQGEMNRPPKSKDGLSIAYVARIHPHKNLLFALETLRHVRGKVTFDIYGPLEDRSYFFACERAIAQLPENVTATYRGELLPYEVSSVLNQHDLLFLPTKSENFCHSLFESLSVGCPVLTSDQTPWHDLASSNAGWDLPLARPEAFVAALNQMAAMDDRSYARWRAGARTYAAGKAAANQASLKTREMLRVALSSPAGADLRHRPPGHADDATNR